MILGIDPKVDYAFKYLLGRESTRALLIDVLNNVLELPLGHQIQNVELLNPYNLQETLDDKLSILDIKARDETGRQFNIEMQMLAFPDYPSRIIYYWSKLHQQQLHDGDDYGTLRPTISINFLNHILFPKVSDYHLRFRLFEERHHFELGDAAEFHIIELPKFNKGVADLTSGLDLWLYFLRFAEKIDTDAVWPALREQPIIRAIEELKMLTQTDIERERYEARRKAHLDHNSAMNFVREEGETAGKQMGEQIGEHIGTIRLCEDILRLPVTPREKLLSLSLEDLKRLAEDLKRKTLNPR